MSEPTDEEFLQGLEDMEVEDEIERLSAMTPEQVRAELRGAGVNVEAAHAKLAQWQQSVPGAGAPTGSAEPAPQGARVLPLAPKRERAPTSGRLYLLLAATLALAAMGGVAGAGLRWIGLGNDRVPARLQHPHRLDLLRPFMETAPQPPPSTDPELHRMRSHPPPTGDPASVRALRVRAFAACDQSRWQECLRDLDRARDLDPDGERAPRVARYRHRAEPHRPVDLL